MKKWFLLFSCYFLLEVNLSAQNPTFGLGIDLLGPVGLSSLHLSLEPNEKLQFSIGGGFNGVYGGAKVYFFEGLDWRIYAGTYITRFNRLELIDYSLLDNGSASGLYVPVGIESFRWDHIYSTFELAYRNLNTGNEPYSPVYLCLKFIYRI